MLAGTVFGVLHNNGGRNWQFTAWATAVGVSYGLAFVSTQDLVVPITAHSAANIAAATYWLQADAKQKQN